MSDFGDGIGAVALLGTRVAIIERPGWAWQQNIGVQLVDFGNIDHPHSIRTEYVTMTECGAAQGRTTDESIAFLDSDVVVVSGPEWDNCARINFADSDQPISYFDPFEGRPHTLDADTNSQHIVVGDSEGLIGE